MCTVYKNILVISIFLISQKAFAGHPLRSDDAGIIGMNKIQLELTPEFWKHSDESRFLIPGVITYGVLENLDAVAGIHYCSLQYLNEQSDIYGFSDINVELKLRLFEFHSFQLALKPGILLPTGDYSKSLGTRKLGYSFFVIADQQVSSVLFHLNLGYILNENRLFENENLWYASFATEIPISSNLTFVTDVGIITNAEKAEDGHPAFILGGIIYSLNENIDLDLGLQTGLNKYESDLTLLIGITALF
jgi:hypothetical protein